MHVSSSSLVKIVSVLEGEKNPARFLSWACPLSMRASSPCESTWWIIEKIFRWVACLWLEGAVD